MGCVNEDENLALHSFGAGLFFGGYDIYMICRTCRSTFVQSGSSVVQGVLVLLTVSSCCLTVARFAMGIHPKLEAPRDVFVPILEWLDALTIMMYAVISVFMHVGKIDYTGIAIVPTTTSSITKGGAVELELPCVMVQE